MTNTERQEIWETYPDYDFIEVSNFGNVRTKDRYVKTKNGQRFVKGRILKQYSNDHGYMYVTFRVDGKIVHLRVQRVVATCFIPNLDNLPEVNHKDNNRTNNAASNLEWCTGSYNCQYREKYGKASGRPVIAIKPETSDVFWFESQHEAARQLGFAYQNVGAIINGKQNTAGGYSFLNADENAVEKARAKFGDEIASKVKKLMSEHLN